MPGLVGQETLRQELVEWQEVAPRRGVTDPGVVDHQQVEAFVRPLANALSSVVFYEIPLFGQTFPIIVLWLAVAALFFTLYLVSSMSAVWAWHCDMCAACTTTRRPAVKFPISRRWSTWTCSWMMENI